MMNLANETNGPNNSASEYIALMVEHVEKKDQTGEPNKTDPSTINGNHDDETKNGGLNPNQVKCETEKSREEKVTIGRCTKVCCCIHGTYNAVIAVLIGVVCYLAFQPRTSCPKYWLNYEGTCFHFSDVEDTWNSSQKNCSSYGGSLVLVATPEELAFVKRYKSRTDYWIGLQREAVGEPWKWPNGSVFNNLFEIRADGHCAYLNDEEASSTWCDTRRNWICSKFLHAPL